MEIGWYVGTGVSVVVLVVGVVAWIRSQRRRVRNRWAGWFILFGVCALVSAYVNLLY
jgi:hypothetical protein